MILADWPIARPPDWPNWLDAPSADPTDEIRESIRRSRPFGDALWTVQTAARLSLAWTLRPRGRPPAPKADES